MEVQYISRVVAYRIHARLARLAAVRALRMAHAAHPMPEHVGNYHRSNIEWLYRSRIAASLYQFGTVEGE